MNNNIHIKYYLLLLIPLIENVCSFNLINSFFVNKQVVNNPIKMCSVGLSFGQSNSTVSPYRADSSNYYLDNLNMKNFMNNFIKNNNVKTNNFIDTTKLRLSSSNKIKTNYYLNNLNMNHFMNNFIKNNNVKTNNFIDTSLSSSNNIKTNTYYVDDLLIEKNFTRIILNLRKGNNSLFYINETINNSDELYS
jgi:hypothetical protein